MLIKPIYDAYLRLRSSSESELLTPLQFVRLPYQRRLWLSGCGFEILTDRFFPFYKPNQVVLVQHTTTDMYVQNVPDNLELENFIPLSWNDLHIFIPAKNEWIVLFPFEYRIVVPE